MMFVEVKRKGAKNMTKKDLVEKLDVMINYHNKNLTKEQYYLLLEVLDYLKGSEKK